MLRFIKIAHTFVWLIMTVANFMAFYFAYNSQFDMWFYIPFFLIVGESLIIVFNRWTCPLTPIAGKYTEDRSHNFDIYLPLWLAKYNKEIFTALIILEIAIVVVKNYI